MDHFAKVNVGWTFIVERAPWCWGFYERLVRFLKQALKTRIGRKRVDWARLKTIRIELSPIDVRLQQVGTL